MPLALPSLQSVEKNAMFFVYKGLSLLVHYTVLANNYASPVNDELSTFIP
jgi:hypothetical protein